MANKSGPSIVTPVATVSFPWFDKPQPSDKPGGVAKYSAAFVFAPGENLAALEKAALDVAVAQLGPQITVKVPVTPATPTGERVIPTAEAFAKGLFHTPFRRDGELKGYPEGSVFINARSNNKPGFVYNYADPATGKPAKVPAELIASVFYPGAKVRAAINPYWFDNSGKKGVTFGLNNVQFIADGERLDNRKKAEDEFTAELAESPADLSMVM
jgi:hypothetical protein